MKSSITNVSEILSSAENIFSAGFSAGYNFDEINAKEYFEELLESSTYPSPIFSGIIIMEKSENDFTIIDGLQRLTTVSLLLCALCQNYKNTTKNNDAARVKIMERFLINLNSPKLKLDGEEQGLYKKILFSEKLSRAEKKSNLYLVYKRFLNGMKEQKTSGTELFKIISKIQFMTVIIDKTEVSIRELYQALNSNKYESQFNLITDFISQKNKKAGAIWRTNAKSFKSLNIPELYGDFLRDFLTIQNKGKRPDKNALYNKFKSYFSEISKYQDTEKIIGNICRYSRYYLKIIKSDFDDFEIQKQFVILNENNGKDAYPYLMEVLDDFDNLHIDKDVFQNILTMINSFIINRQSSDSPEDGLDFAGISTEINKMLILKDYTPDFGEDNKLTINEINKIPTFEV